MENNQNKSYSQDSSDLQNKAQNTDYKNSGSNHNPVQHERNNLESDSRANNNKDWDTNPLYNPDDDFEEDSDMDDADLDDIDPEDDDDENDLEK
jgi:hypothetical protein